MAELTSILEIFPTNINPSTLEVVGEDAPQTKIDQFLKSKALAAKTQKEYRRELQRFLTWANKEWADITSQDVAEFKFQLQQRGLSPASVAQAIAALKSFFRWMVDSHYLAENPTLAVRTPSPPEPQAQHFSETEMTALWATLEFRGDTEVRDRAILSVLEHGLRVDEVSQLIVGDFDGQRITIRKAKRDSVGQVPLVSEAVIAVQAYLEERQERGAELRPESPLFLSTSHNSRGKRLGYRGIYDLIKDLGEVAGVENCHPHRLRHTFATRLVLKGVDSYLARKLTRHKSESAFRRYSEHARQQAAEAAFHAAFGD
ncbi:tyrosine-type recombinase/integrase [Phormidesmis sp. 146-12]